MTEKEQQYFEIMLEKILHEVETVAEGHGLLDQKLERFHKEAKADHHLAMDLIKHSHDELKKEIQAVDKRSEARDAALTAEIQAVDKKLTSEIQAVDKKLTSEIRNVFDNITSSEF